MIGLQNETKEFLTLLSQLTEDDPRVVDLYRQRIVESSLFQAVNRYDDELLFISPRAIQLKERLQQLHFEHTTITELNKVNDEMNELYEQLESLCTYSEEQIRQGLYNIDVIHRQLLDKLKTEDKDLYTKIQLLLESKENPPADSFRQYLRKNRNEKIRNEYFRIRSSKMQIEDDRRALMFKGLGTAIGAFFGLLLSNLFIGLEMPIFVLIVILFFLRSIWRVDWLKNISLLLLTSLLGMFIGLTIYQLIHLGEWRDYSSLQTLYMNGLGVIIGGFTGYMIVSKRIFLSSKEKSIPLPSILQIADRRFQILAIVCTVYGFLWISAVHGNMTIFEHIDNKVANLFHLNGSHLSKGKVEVTAYHANLRTEPVVQPSTLYSSAEKGTVLEFVETKSVDGTTWYKVKVDSGNTFAWISGKTVQLLTQ